MRWLLLVAAPFVIAADAGAASPRAEKVVVRDVLGPEGPLYVDGELYYVGWISGTVIFQNRRMAEAPSMAADSYKSLGMACIAAR